MNLSPSLRVQEVSPHLQIIDGCLLFYSPVLSSVSCSVLNSFMMGKSLNLCVLYSFHLQIEMIMFTGDVLLRLGNICL